MADAWGGSWGSTWAISWTRVGPPTTIDDLVPGGGIPRSRGPSGRGISRAELDRAVHALRAMRASTGSLRKKANRERAAEVYAEASRALGLLEDADVAVPLDALTAALQAAASARKTGVIMAELTRIERDVQAMLAYLAARQDDEDAAAALLMVM